MTILAMEIEELDDGYILRWEDRATQVLRPIAGLVKSKAVQENYLNLGAEVATVLNGWRERRKKERNP